MPSVIDNGARICIKLLIPDQIEYRAALTAQLNQLGSWVSWDHERADYDTIPVKNRQVAQLWANVVAEARFGDCETPESDCVEYPPHSSFITWHPHNPYTEPNWTSAGFLIGAWFVANDLSAIALDATVGAVVTDLLHIGPVPTEFAEFRINLFGMGQVEIHLANVIAGGMAIIRVDGVIFDAVDLEQDVTSIPPETENTQIWEHEFTTPGAHQIIVSMAPVVDDSATLL